MEGDVNVMTINESRLMSYSVPWVPGDNLMTYDLLPWWAPEVENTTAAFIVAFYQDQLILARNLKRGLEIPGGHIEEGESVKDAAIRELREETGAVANKPRPFIRSTLTCNFEKPEGYKYPHPVSHMEFMISDVKEMTGKIMENEVGAPILIPTEVIDGVIVRSLGHLSNEDRLEFLDKMKNESFRLKIDAAAYAHEDWKEEQRIRKLRKFMLIPAEGSDLMTELESAGGEFLYFNEAGNYAVGGFDTEESGRSFQEKWNKTT